MQEIADALVGVDVPVLVKNPVNPDLELWIGAMQRLYNAGLRRIGAIHRGFSAYGKHLYRNMPQWHIPIELRRRLPNLTIFCDPSHIGGKRELVAPLSQQAMDMGFDGLIIESHCEPDSAWSDKSQQVTPEVLNFILHTLVVRDSVQLPDLALLRQPLTDTDDIVVCPDCGAPYHRACYEKQGACVYAGKHGAGFEWTPPASARPERRCPNCGASNPEDAARCSHCGSTFEAGPTPPPRVDANRQAQQSAGGFNYARLYQEAQGGGYWQSSAASADEIDGISAEDWAAYLGPASPSYLRDFAQMQKYGRKSSICFSALLFGPLYFFYRKAWKPAFAFLAVDLLLNLPALLELLVLSESAFAPAISSSSALSGPAGLHCQLCGHGPERDVRQVPLPPQRRRTHPPDRGRVPRKGPAGGSPPAQGGVSWAAVVGVCTLMMVAGAVFSLSWAPMWTPSWGW